MSGHSQVPRALFIVMMLGINAMPRWRLPVWLFAAVLLAGCAAHSEQGDDESGVPMPSVRMALLKIPLNRSDKTPLAGHDPLDRFTPEPVAVAYEPEW